MSDRVTAGGQERYCPACERSFNTGDVCPQDGTTLVLLSSGPDQLIGTTLDGRFTILEKLGSGGMGTVYRGVQLSVDREVAIKVVSPNLLAHSEVIKRFLREAKLASRLNHPNAVAVLDFGRATGDLFFLVMERLVGPTLEDVIASGGRLPVDRALAIARQICDALVGAHQLSIVHRDLKPSNIMIVKGPGGRDVVKVLDFGLAKLVSSEVSAQVTRTGIMLGTPAYMSPELAAGREADARADLYALGCILYEMLRGRVPFIGKTLHETLVLHATEPPRPIPDVPLWLMAVVSRLLAKNAADRYLTAEETLAALSAAGPELEGAASDRLTPLPAPLSPPEETRLPAGAVETGPTLVGPTPVPTPVVAQSAPAIDVPARRPGRVIVLALALALLAAAALLSWQLRGEEPASSPVSPAAAPDPRPAAVVPAAAETATATGSLASAPDASPPVADAGAAEPERASRARRNRRQSGKPRRERKPDEEGQGGEARKGGLPF